LSERGTAAAHRLADRLAGVEIDRIISSPLMRAVETANIVGGDRPMEIELDKRLEELDYGTWEGLTVDEIDRRFPGEHDLYEADPATYRVGGAESGRDVARRLAPVINGLVDWAAADPGEETVLLVAHSSTNRILLASVLGVPLRDYRRRFRQDWANLTVLRWSDTDSGPMLLLANDVAHTRGIHGSTWEKT